MVSMLMNSSGRNTKIYNYERDVAFYDRDDREPRETISSKTKQATQNELFMRPIGSWKKLVNYTRFGFLSFVILAPHEDSYKRCSNNRYDSGQVEVQPVGAGDPRYNLAYALLMMPDREAFLFARAPTKTKTERESEHDASDVVVWLNWFPLEADPEMANILCHGVHVYRGCISKQRKWKYPVEQALANFDCFTYCLLSRSHDEPFLRSTVIYPLITENDTVYLDPFAPNYEKLYVEVESIGRMRGKMKESAPRLTSSEMKVKLLLRFFWHDSSPLSELLCAYYFSSDCRFSRLPLELMYLVLFQALFIGDLPDWSISRVLSTLSVEAASVQLGRPVTVKDCIDAKEGEVCARYCPPGLKPGLKPRMPRQLSPIERLALSQEAVEFLASPWVLPTTTSEIKSNSSENV